MYVPSSYRIEDPATLHAFIARYGFATLVTGGDEPMATHLPLLLDRDRGPLGTLIGHVARANSQWRADHANCASLAIFHGPHAYLSPAWYRSNAPAVPTWNYAVVHAKGTISLMQDPERVRAVVRALSQQYEPTPLPRNNQVVGEAEEKLLEAIVAFEMPIDRLEGKFKLSQNRAREDQIGAVEGLEKQGDADSQALAEF
ncbi:MAG TPA: FMN-binding negative transcriptional regulator, partial [Tepidisphaeraceae bacterium]|nr:FMN-binding negative transcriptional regulator [Tepidisphaeraceae bacterium]